MRRNPVMVTSLLLAVFAAACGRAASAVDYVRLSSLDSLRNAFNADSGKVRAIFLASPT